MDSSEQAARACSQGHQQAPSMPSRSRTLSASDSGAHSKAAEPYFDVDLTSDNSCENSLGDMSQINVSTNRLQLEVSEDTKISPKTNSKTTMILESNLAELKSQATNLKAQNEVLQHESTAAKEEARVWQLRHASTKASLESTKSILRTLEGQYAVATTALEDAVEDLADKEETLSRCQLEIQNFLKKIELLKDMELNNAKIVEAERRMSQNTQRELEARQQDTEQDLQQMTKQLKDSNNDRAKFEKLASSFETTLEHFVEENKQWFHEKNKLKMKLADAKKDLKSAQQNYEKERTQLQVRYNEAEAEHIAQQEHWNEKKTELLQKLQDSRGLSQRYNFNISDSELLEHWDNLRHRIGQFVDKYTRPVSSVAQSRLDETWQILSPNAADLLATPFLYTFAFEAYVWQWLVRFVFAPTSQVWAGSIGIQFHKLSQEAQALLREPGEPLIAEYHTWRANSSNLLSRLSEHTVNFENAHRETGVMVDGLSLLLAPNGFNEMGSAFLDVACFDKQNYIEDALAIFMDARRFDIMRRKLRADISVQFGLPPQRGTAVMSGFNLDSGFMKDVSPYVTSQSSNQTMIVKLCVSPALLRVGNSDGSGYKRRAVLGKMCVICNIDKPGSAATQSDPRPPPPMSTNQQVWEGDIRLLPNHTTAEVVGQTPMRKHVLAIQNNKPAENSDVPKQGELEPRVKVEQEPLNIGSFAQASGSSSRVTRTRTTSTPTKEHYSGSGARSSLRRASANKRHYDENDDSIDEAIELAEPDLHKEKNPVPDPRPNKKQKMKVDPGDEDYQP